MFLSANRHPLRRNMREVIVDRMSEPRHEPPETEADRRKANIALLIGAIILIGGGIWLVNALIDARDAEICMESGRRNCNPIEAPAR